MNLKKTFNHCLVENPFNHSSWELKKPSISVVGNLKKTFNHCLVEKPFKLGPNEVGPFELVVHVLNRLILFSYFSRKSKKKQKGH